MSQPPQPPGGWGQQPGAGPPPTQVGGFAPPPPTQVGGFAPPGRKPPGRPSGAPDGSSGGRRRSSGPLIAGIVVLAVVTLVATVLAVVLDTGDGTPAAATPAAATPAAATPALPPPSGSPAPAPLPPPVPTGGPAGTAELDAFLATLPPDFADCEGTDPGDDGDLLAAGCGAATSQPGPTAARFRRYPDVATLDEVFTGDVGTSGLTEFPEGEDCATGTGYGGWDVDGVVGGMVGCAILDDGTVSIAWTDDEYRTAGVVVAHGTTQDDVAQLYEWWRENSFYR